jgi:1-acyl-sn-glycerol-3-phosphate acyltransferase
MPLSLLRAVFWTDPMIVLATVVMGSASIICSFFDRDGSRQHAVSRMWARMLLRIAGVEARVTGLEHVKPEQNYLFIGNHLSLMDTPVILSKIPHQFLFLVNVRFVRMPFLGTHLRRGGHIPIDSNDTRASLRALNDAAKRMRERNVSMLVFPEGSRSKDGRIAEFKEGAAVIAIKAGVPVLPFVLRGTREILPVGSAHIRKGVVDLAVGPPISTEGLTLKDRERFTAVMRARLIEMHQEMEGSPVETVRQ